MSRRGVVATLGAGLASACSPLGAFNALTPRPLGVAREAGLPYGPLPRHRLDVYRPRRSEAKPPLMVFIYGGGWEWGERADYAFAGRAFAAQGFVTAVPDYRLTGEAPFPAFLQDCARAVAWCQANAERLGADPARTVLAGHSAGAYNAAMLALDGRWLDEAKASAPVRAWAGLSGPYDFLPLEPGPGLRTFGRVADLAHTQPVNFVTPASPPTFLACGSRDTVVKPRNTEHLAARLRGAGVAAGVDVYDRAGHAEPLLALTWPMRLRLPVLTRSTDFLRGAL